MTAAVVSRRTFSRRVEAQLVLARKVGSRPQPKRKPKAVVEATAPASRTRVVLVLDVGGIIASSEGCGVPMSTRQTTDHDRGTAKNSRAKRGPAQQTVADTSRRAAGHSLLALQRTAGNAAVSRLIAIERAHQMDEDSAENEEAATASEPERDDWDADFEVEIRKPPQRVVRDSDSVDEGEDEIAAPDGDIPTDAKEISLPDISMSVESQADDVDAIASKIRYSATVNKGGAPSAFGVTRWGNFKITGIKVKLKNAVYKVGFKLKNPIVFNVASGGRENISSKNDADLTNANYPTASTDLTPRMGVQGGKPLRSQFWAKDLTLRHERFHSRERKRLNKAGAADAQTWLNTQVATTEEEVKTLIEQVPDKVIESSQAAVGSLDEKESRAYGDGAPSYQARADAIKKKGDKGTGHGGYKA